MLAVAALAGLLGCAAAAEAVSVTVDVIFAVTVAVTVVVVGALAVVAELHPITRAIGAQIAVVIKSPRLFMTRYRNSA